MSRLRSNRRKHDRNPKNKFQVLVQKNIGQPYERRAKIYASLALAREAKLNYINQGFRALVDFEQKTPKK